MQSTVLIMAVLCNNREIANRALDVWGYRDVFAWGGTPRQTAAMHIERLGLYEEEVKGGKRKTTLWWEVLQKIRTLEKEVVRTSFLSAARHREGCAHGCSAAAI